MNIGFLSLDHISSNSSKDETNCILDYGVSSRNIYYRMCIHLSFPTFSLKSHRSWIDQGVFGMNITVLVDSTHGTLAHFVAAAIAFTLLTVWIMVAFQSKSMYPDHTPLWVRFGWPALLCTNLLKRKSEKHWELPM